MANHLVSGVLVPDAVSGHQALELCNTRAAWREESPREYLVSYDALAVWAGDVDLLSPGEVRALRRTAQRHPRVAARAVGAAIALRESWYDVSTAPWEQRAFPSDGLDTIGAFASDALAASRLVPDTEGRVRADGGDVRAGSAALLVPVHRAALAAYELLSTGDVAHVGRCSGHGCGWLFYDPGHRRHWCIMALCGNRAKARAFAERRRNSA